MNVSISFFLCVRVHTFNQFRMCEHAYTADDMHEPTVKKKLSTIQRRPKKKFNNIQGEMSLYNNASTFECLPCAEGCDACKDASPCVAALNWTMRTSILVLACAVIGFLPPAAYFTFRYQQVKVS